MISNHLKMWNSYSYAMMWHLFLVWYSAMNTKQVQGVSISQWKAGIPIGPGTEDSGRFRISQVLCVKKVCDITYDMLRK